MSTIWIIEKQQQNALAPITKSLLGNYPIRVFSSYKSFKTLIKTSSNNLPDILVLDDETIDSSVSVDELLEIYLPTTKKILVGSKININNSSNLINYPKPIDELKFLKFIKTELLKLSGYSIKMAEPIRFKDIIIDFEKFLIKKIYDNTQEEMSPKESRILKLLIEHRGKCVDKKIIKNEIWPNTAITHRVIDSHISRLRKKLQHTEVSIENSYGHGYILK